MSAAILQGVPATTLDTDIWVELPPRRYARVLSICQKLGATIMANTVVALADDSIVNFIYEIDGLRAFATEYTHAHRLNWQGTTVAVLPLERIIKSKKATGRPKDLAHLPLLKQTLSLQKKIKRRAD